MGQTEKNGLHTEEDDAFLGGDTKYGNDVSRNESFLQKLKANKEFRHRIIHTAVVCWSFITLGWSSGMGGPTFPDLRLIVQKDISAASWLFTVGAIGYVVGSLVFGVLYDRLNKLLILAFSTFGFAVFNGAKPWCSLYPVMLLIQFLVGAFCGGLDTGGNADIPYIWGTESGPYMQALHLCFCLGAILSPLATEPFLAKKVCLPKGNDAENTTALQISATMDFHNVSQDTNNLICEEAYEDTKVQWAYLISAILILTATLGYIFLYCKMSHVHANLAKQQKDSKEMSSGNGSDQEYMSISLKATLLILLSSLMMSYCVMEDGFASFLMTFCLTRLGWSKETGSYATTVFWACFVVGRFAGIFMVNCFKQKTLLTTHFIYIALSLIGLLLATFFTIIPLIWVFTGTLGYSMSVVFPCIFGWTSENIMQITGKISAMFLVSAGLGAMFFPLLVGYLMEYHSPMWFVYVLVAMMGFTILLYISIRLIAHFFILSKEKKKTEIELMVLKSKKVKIDKDNNLYPVLR